MGIAVGAQLYTVRAYTQTERDLRETLRRVAGMGYDAVQLSAVGPVAPETVARLCGEFGLTVALTHTPEARILSDTEQVIEEHRGYDCRYVGLGAMGEKYRSAAWADRFAADFLPAMTKLRDAGQLFMYHNHAFEFERMADGRRLMELLLEIPSDLIGFTLDTYWVQFAGGNVREWIKRLAGRIPCVHLKDMTVRGFENRMAPVGRGNMGFEGILALLMEQGGTEFVLVEQDDCYGEDPFACLEESLGFIRKHL